MDSTTEGGSPSLSGVMVQDVSYRYRLTLVPDDHPGPGDGGHSRLGTPPADQGWELVSTSVSRDGDTVALFRRQDRRTDRAS